MNLHNDSVQESLELIADGETAKLAAKMSPAPSWYEQEPDATERW